MNKDLEQAKALLENNEEYTCAACRAGESFASEEHGVRPLMRWLNEGTDLSGASAADRIVGKAAAFLYVLLGVRTVYAPLMSVPAGNAARPRHRGDRGHGRAGHPQPHGHGLLPDGEHGMGHLRSARGQGGAGTENFRDDGKEIDTFTC